MSTDTTTTSVTRTVADQELPAAGVWQIDPSHSQVAFSVRHLGLSKVRGRFTRFSGTVHVADEPSRSAVEAEVELASVDTGDEGRDAHLRSADFFDVDTNPHMRFRSTAVAAERGSWRVEGELTLHGVTRPVVLETDFEGAVTADPWGNARVAFSASTELDREVFGLTWNQALETGGVLVGRKVRVDLEIQAVRGR